VSSLDAWHVRRRVQSTSPAADRRDDRANEERRATENLRAIRETVRDDRGWVLVTQGFLPWPAQLSYREPVLATEHGLAMGDLTIEAVQADPLGPIGLLWKGKSNDRDPSKVLGPYFSQMLDLAAGARVPLELRFEALEYLNSSTINAIIGLIQSARDRSVRLVLVFDHRRRWQKFSSDALKVFVHDDGLLEFRTAGD
jgi:hypothetical protein